MKKKSSTPNKPSTPASKLVTVKTPVTPEPSPTCIADLVEPRYRHMKSRPSPNDTMAAIQAEAQRLKERQEREIERQREQEEEQMISMAYNLKVLRRAFMSWKQFMCRHDATMTRALKLLRFRTLSRAFEKWKAWLREQRVDCETVPAPVVLAALQADALREKQRREEEMLQLKRLEEDRIIEMAFQMKLLRRCFLQWKADITRHKLALARAAAVLRFRLLSRAFAGWKAWIHEQQLSREAQSYQTRIIEQERQMRHAAHVNRIRTLQRYYRYWKQWTKDRMKEHEEERLRVMRAARIEVIVKHAQRKQEECAKAEAEKTIMSKENLFQIIPPTVQIHTPKPTHARQPLSARMSSPAALVGESSPTVVPASAPAKIRVPVRLPSPRMLNVNCCL